MFNSVQEQLRRIKNSDTRIRFVYLMRPIDGKMVFLVDAEGNKSHDYSPPGQLYDEAKPAEFYPFTGKTVADPWVMGPVTDRWGTWISANAYVLNSAGKPVAVLGTDVSVDKALSSFNQIIKIGILYDILACVLFALVLMQWIIWQYGKDRRAAMQREMNESMVRLNTELVEADRMKSEFIESASHDLRGPVTAVSTAVQVMDNNFGVDLPEQGKKLLEIAKSGSRRLVDLVTNLLDMTRIEAGDITVDRKTVDLEELVNDTVRVFTALAAEKGIAVEVSFKSDDFNAEVDRQVVRRVLENLVSNAIKYTDSGRITVEAEAGPKAIVFTVSDTGRGIPAEYVDEVFKKFSRAHLNTSSDDRGTGLGLALSKGLVDAHGGRIWLESEEGKGSTFHFEIPR